MLPKLCELALKPGLFFKVWSQSSTWWSVARLGLESNLFLGGLFKSFVASPSWDSLLDLARLGALELES